MIENELDRLDVLFGLGVRMCGITYSESNQLGGGVKDPGDGGLTRFGLDAVRRMNRLGMAIDLSHTGDVTAMQTCEASERPVFLSHSGARALFSERKLKEDDLLKAVAATGGMIGIEGSPHTTISPAHPRHSLEAVMDHFEYCVDVMGIDHVGFGPDTFFGDHVGLHVLYAGNLDTGEVGEFEPVEYVEGMENPSEFPNVIRWLVGHGYDDEQIAKVVGGNALRALARRLGLELSRGGQGSLERGDEALDRVRVGDGGRSQTGGASRGGGDRADGDHLRDAAARAEGAHEPVHGRRARERHGVDVATPERIARLSRERRGEDRPVGIDPFGLPALPLERLLQPFRARCRRERRARAPDRGGRRGRAPRS